MKRRLKIMNPMIKKWTATTMALAMAVSMGVSVSAKPQSSKNIDVSKLPASTSTATAPAASASDYSINLSGNDVQFVKNGKVAATYAAKLAANAKAPDVNVILSSSGNLCLNFTKGDGKAVNVSLGQQASVAFTGDYNTLTFDTTVPTGRGFTVSGNVTTLNVNAPSAVTVASGATVNSLKVGNSSASVTVESGATVSAAAASNASSVTGMSNVGSMAEVTASVTGTTTSSTTTSNSSSTVTSGGLMVEMKDASDTKKYAANIAYLPNNVISILPKKNATLENLMKDIKLTVRRAENNNILTGDWKFIGGVNAKSKATPGEYKYQFTPHQAYKGFDIIVQVVGAGSANSSVSEKPQISFYSGVGRGKGGSVDVDVTLPAGVTKGDVLELHAGNWSTTKTLVTSDAGETRTYTVQIDEDQAKNAKTKVYVVLRTGGASLTSNTINYTYNEDGDTKTLKKPGLSISPSHGDGENITVKVTLPASAGDGDEVRITYTRSGSGSREADSKELSDSDGGKTISFNIGVSGDEDDEIKIKATLTSGGSSISSDTKTYRIDK